MLTINEKNRDLALRLYPSGPTRIRARVTKGEDRIFQLIVGQTLLLVAWSDDLQKLREFADRHGWSTEAL